MRAPDVRWRPKEPPPPAWKREEHAFHSKRSHSTTPRPSTSPATPRNASTMIAPADSAPSSRITRQPAASVHVRIEDDPPATTESLDEVKKLTSPPRKTAKAAASPSAAANSKQNMRALGFIALSALNLSLMRACVKYASGYVSSHQTVLWRSGIAWALNYVSRHDACSPCRQCLGPSDRGHTVDAGALQRRERVRGAAAARHAAVPQLRGHRRHQHPVLRHVQDGADGRRRHHLYQPHHHLPPGTLSSL